METATVLWAIFPAGHAEGQKVIPLLVLLKEDYDDFVARYSPSLVVPGNIVGSDEFLSRLEDEYPEMVKDVRSWGRAVKLQLLPNDIPVYQPSLESLIS
jgi:hypothetical protein